VPRLRRGSGDALSPRVVVIDDDADLRATVRITLRAQGWDVLEAAAPDEGVALAERSRPDIVLLDVQFPGEMRDGFAVCRELRSLPATKDTPVVLFTATDDAESRAFASAVGATAYLVKPFGAVELQRFLGLVKGTIGSQPALGLYLIDAGVATPPQLERALAEQRLRQGPKVPLGKIMVELGYAQQADIDAAIGKQSRARESPPRAARPGERRVVIADDHARVREGLREAIAAEDGLSVVGVAADGNEALRQVRTLRPDVLVLDNDMPHKNGIDVLAVVRRDVPETAIVMFTLDETVRDRALDLGASAVVTKDQSLGVLLAEVRTARAGTKPAAPVPPGVLLAAHGAARRAWGAILRQRRTIATLGIVAVGYTGAFLLAEPIVGASAAVVGFAAVTIAGGLLGLEGGLAGGVIVSLLTLVLWFATGHRIGEPVTTVGGNGIGVLALIGVGAGFGAMRSARGRFNTEARNASAIAETALVLATATGPEVLRIVARGALEAIKGDCVLVFLPVPGGGLELVAVHGGPQTSVGSRHIGHAIGRARERDLPFVTDAGAGSTGVEIPGMRTALIAPLPETSDGVRGVMAVLSARRDVYRSLHINTAAAYASFAGLALQTHLRSAVPTGEPMAQRVSARAR